MNLLAVTSFSALTPRGREGAAFALSQRNVKRGAFRRSCELPSGPCSRAALQAIPYPTTKGVTSHNVCIRLAPLITPGRYRKTGLPSTGLSNWVDALRFSNN